MIERRNRRRQRALETEGSVHDRRVPTGMLASMALVIAVVITAGCSSGRGPANTVGTTSSTAAGSKATQRSNGDGGSTQATDDDSGSATTRSRSGQDGSGGAKVIQLGDTFTAGNWSYVINEANVREGEGVSFKVLDLKMSGTNNGSEPSMAGSLIFTVDADGKQTKNCVADIKASTSPGGSADFVVSCSLNAFGDASTDGGTVTITDVSDEVVAKLTLG